MILCIKTASGALFICAGSYYFDSDYLRYLRYLRCVKPGFQPSGVKPTALTSGPQRSVSAFSMAASSAGEVGMTSR